MSQKNTLINSFQSIIKPFSFGVAVAVPAVGLVWYIENVYLVMNNIPPELLVQMSSHNYWGIIITFLVLGVVATLMPFLTYVFYWKRTEVKVPINKTITYFLGWLAFVIYALFRGCF